MEPACLKNTLCERAFTGGKALLSLSLPLQRQIKPNALFVHLLCSIASQLTHSTPRSHCSVHICPACTTAVRYALLLIHTTAVHHTTTLMNNESCNLETSCMSPTWAPSTCLTDLLWKREEKRRGRTKLIQPTTV